jgi:hypothetical protein
VGIEAVGRGRLCQRLGGGGRVPSTPACAQDDPASDSEADLETPLSDQPPGEEPLAGGKYGRLDSTVLGEQQEQWICACGCTAYPRLHAPLAAYAFKRDADGQGLADGERHMSTD